MIIGIDFSIFRSYQGTEVVSENLVAELVRRQPAHTFVVFKPASVLPVFDNLTQNHPNLKVVTLHRFSGGLGAIVRQQIVVPLAVIQHRVDVLYSPSPFFPYLAPIKKICEIHDCAYKLYPEFRSLWSRFYISLSIRLAPWLCQRIIAPSEFSRQELLNVYRLRPEQVAVVMNALPSLPTVDNAAIASVRQRYRIAEHPYFVFIGISRPRKNLSGLLKAFKKFSVTHPKHRLVLGGKIDTTFVDLRQQAAALGIDDSVIQTGFVSNEDKVALYRGSVALVYPSFYEGFGLPILEAQSLEVPVITSATAAMPEVAGQGALLVDPHDTEALAQAMTTLADQAEYRQQLITAGHINVARFSWAASARQFMEVVQSL